MSSAPTTPDQRIPKLDLLDTDELLDLLTERDLVCGTDYGDALRFLAGMRGRDVGVLISDRISGEQIAFHRGVLGPAQKPWLDVAEDGPIWFDTFRDREVVGYYLLPGCPEKITECWVSRQTVEIHSERIVWRVSDMTPERH